MGERRRGGHADAAVLIGCGDGFDLFNGVKPLCMVNVFVKSIVRY